MKTIILTEKQAKAIKPYIEKVKPVKKVNAGLMDAIVYGGGMCEDCDYKIGMENDSNLEYGHVVQESEGKITLYHGLSAKSLEYVLTHGDALEPRVCSEGGPKAIYLSTRKLNYPFTVKFDVPLSEFGNFYDGKFEQLTNVDYIFHDSLPISSFNGEILCNDIHIPVESFFVVLNLGEEPNEFHKKYTANDIEESLRDSFEHYPTVWKQFVVPYLNKLKLIEETVTADDVDLSSFELKKELHPKFWKDKKLDSRIRLKLLDVADKFIDTLDVDEEPDDIVITGSLANYNWDEGASDIDLHVMMNFKKIDDDVEFLKDYFDAKKKIWNEQHEDISIYGFPVEVYVQDTEEEHKSNGVYSIEKNKWVKEPSLEKLDTDELDDDEAKEKIAEYQNRIDELEVRLEKLVSAAQASGESKPAEMDIEKLLEDTDALYEEIRDIRRSALKKAESEINTGNIIFKALRRNGYMEKLINIKTHCFDLSLSLF